MKKLLWFILVTIIVSLMAVPLLASSEKGGKEAEVKYKIAYVCKIKTMDWFLNEEQGIKDFCAMNDDCEYVGGVDADMDIEAFLSGVDQMIAKGANALALVVPNPVIGPSIADKAYAAGVKMVTIDDPFQDSEGNYVPHVGMNGVQAGNIAGEKAVDYMRANGLDKKTDGSVHIYSMAIDQIPPCKDRNDGFEEIMKRELKNWNWKRDYTRLDFSAGGAAIEDATNAAAQVIQANPDAKIWVVYGCDDSSAVGASLAMTERNMDTTSISIPQNGASPVITEWEKGNPYIKFSITQFAWVHGWLGAQILYDQIVNGVDPKEVTYSPAIAITAEDAKAMYPDGNVTLGRPADMEDQIANKVAGKYYSLKDIKPDFKY